MNVHPETSKPRWSMVPGAAMKATALALPLAAVFFLLPGKWDGRITLLVSGVFWLNTFLFSLLSAWVREKVTAHFATLKS